MIEWILALGTSALVIMVTYSLAFSVMRRFGKRILGPPKPGMQWRSNIVIGPIVLCMALLCMFLLSAGNLSLWGVALLRIDYLLTVVLVGSTIAIVVLLFSERISPTSPAMKPPQDSSGLIAYILLIVVLASVSEEFLFRGVVQNTIDVWFLISIQLGPILLTSGAIVSAVIFSLVHAMPAKMMGISPAVLMTSSFILGLSAGIALTMTMSLIAPILIHSIFNLAGMLLPSLFGRRKLPN